MAGMRVSHTLCYLFDGVLLQIALHGIQLGHAVGNGGACGKCYAPRPGDFIKVLALHKQVTGLLALNNLSTDALSVSCGVLTVTL